MAVYFAKSKFYAQVAAADVASLADHGAVVEVDTSADEGDDPDLDADLDAMPPPTAYLGCRALERRALTIGLERSRLGYVDTIVFQSLEKLEVEVGRAANVHDAGCALTSLFATVVLSVEAQKRWSCAQRIEGLFDAAAANAKARLALQCNCVESRKLLELVVSPTMRRRLMTEVLPRALERFSGSRDVVDAACRFVRWLFWHDVVTLPTPLQTRWRGAADFFEGRVAVTAITDNRLRQQPASVLDVLETALGTYAGDPKSQQAILVAVGASPPKGDGTPGRGEATTAFAASRAASAARGGRANESVRERRGRERARPSTVVPPC
jgi:hypothetical protein